MDIKGFGNLSFDDLRLDALKDQMEAVRARLERPSGYGGSPLSSGLFSLDAATGRGGLPRGQVVRIADPLSVRARSLAYGAVANTVDHGGLVLIFDFNKHFSPDVAANYRINYDDTIVCRPEGLAAGLKIAEEIVQSNVVDLVLVDWPEGDLQQAENEAALQLGDLANAVKNSDTCLLLTTSPRQGRKLGAETDRALTQHADMLIDVKSARRRHRSRTRSLFPFRLSVEEDGERVGPEMQLEMQRNGRLSPDSDLFEAGTQQGIIERRGSTYHYAGEELGRGRERAIHALEDRAELRFAVEREVERGQQGGELRMSMRSSREADARVPAPSSKTGPGDKPQQQAKPAKRFVNTWFAGIEPAPPVLPLRAGERYYFLLQIGAQQAAVGQSEVFTEPDFGRHESLNLLVSLFSEDFRIDNPLLTVHLERSGDSNIVQTAVQPLHAGKCQLRIAISLPRELEVLQRLSVQVEVEASDQAAAPKAAGH